MKEIIVKNNDINKRLDNFLLKLFPAFSRTNIYRLIRLKKIKVNDKKTQFDYRLQINDKVQVFVNQIIHKDDDLAFLKTNGKLKIVYEDANILIVNKPIGISVHDDESKSPNTLINIAKKYLFDTKAWDYRNENSFTPALVHRLDHNTQGLVIIAKNALALKTLNELIKEHKIKKFYKATVHGIIDPKQGILKHFLTPNKATKIVTITNKQISPLSKQIVTKYTTVSHTLTTSELDIELITGRTHQIRAHFAYIGHPLVGERKYTNKFVIKTSKAKYQQLCAYKIIFDFNMEEGGCLSYLSHKTICV